MSLSAPVPSPGNSTLSSSTQAEHIAIIYAGGTFGCTGSPLAPMPAPTFLPLLTQILQGHPGIACHSVAAPHIGDSSQLQASDWIAQVEQIIQLYQQGFQRIVCIHGTDTLAYTAAFLAEALAGWPIRLIVTGSQYPLLDVAGQQLNPEGDALDNLLLAMQQVQQPEPGCHVVFAGACWPAQGVQKVHTTDLQAFAGLPELPPASAATHASHDSVLLIQRLQYLKQLNIATYYALPQDWPQQAAQLQQLLHTPALDALILLGFGAGNLAHSPEIEQLLKQAHARGVLLVIATQVPFGGVDSRYAAGHWLGDLQVLSAARMPVAAVYARLAWVCCQSSDYQQRRQHWLVANQGQDV